VTITPCDVEGNRAFRGGALYFSNSEGVGVIDQCTFHNNVGAEDGAIRVYGAPTVSDCTIFGNQGPLGAGMAVVSTSHAPSLSGTTICGKHLELDEKGAGREVPCPECAEPIIIPSRKHPTGASVWVRPGEAFGRF